MSIRLRLTLTYVALLVAGMGLVLGTSWWLLDGHLHRTVPAPYADAIVARLGAQYGLAIIGTAGLAFGLGWLLAGRALAPVRAIAATARRITHERLDARVRLPDGPDDEVAELAGAFDAMLDRVEASVAAQQRFVANASHELRTPLTVIRTDAEVLLDDPGATREELLDAARAAVATTERTERLLDSLLVLAASTQGTRRDETIDLAAVTRRSVAAAQHDAQAAGLTIEVDAPAPLAVRGDEALLDRLVGNLVDNAVRYGAPGTRARVTLSRADGEAHLRVRSPGEPIANELMSRLAEPFERGSRRRARGSGLGLSIVRAVAEAHGGRLALSAPAAGGLVADVALPSA